MLNPGDQVEKYVVDSLLGEGGMAAVYKVRHTTLDTLHALKVLTLSGKGLTERLVDEGKVQATLRHPNVVRVVDVVEVDGQPGLVMDFVDGPDLDQWIASAKPDPATAEEVFRGIVAGVMAAHAEGLIHRDLKPANVLLARGADGALVPKVADFGLSKAIEGEGSDRRKTRTGLPMGTPAYMAPEQIRDAANVDARADIFSLGCILHELLAHAPAFDGDDAVTIFNAVLADERQRLPDLRSDVPDRVVRTVDRSLVGDRDQRLASCEELLAVLDGVDASDRGLGGLEAHLPPMPAVPKQAVAPALLGLGVLAGAAGVVAVMLLVVVVLAWSGDADPVATDDPATDGDEPDDAEDAEEVDPFTDDTPVPRGGCAGKQGLIGYANARPFLLGQGSRWTLGKPKEVFGGRPTKSNDWRSEWGTVCTLEHGTVVTLIAAPERVRGQGHWIPIYASVVVPPAE